MVDPEALAFRALMRKLHPYAKDNIRYRPTFEESLERVAKATRDQVARLYAEQVGAAHGELAIVGDFDSEPALKKLEGILADWKSSVPYQRIGQAADTKVAAGRETIQVPDKESATYAAGCTMRLNDSDPDYVALTLGNYLLGGSSTSRLWDRLRQKDGFSYSVGSSFSASARDPYGLFLLFAECNPLVMEKADKAAVEELKRAIVKGFAADELVEGVKGYLEDMKVQFASDGNVAGTLRSGLELGRTFDYHAEQQNKIAALKVEDVNRAVARHLSADRLVILRAGDFSKRK
jgi:zinc protease